MQGSDDEAFDEFQVEFLTYLETRLGLERTVVTAMLSQWLVNHPHRGGPGLRKTLPEREPASDQAIR
jgi:hypothetical protein